MGSNSGGYPQGNYDPTQPVYYPYGTTQHGVYPSNPYGVPPPPPIPPRKTNRWLILLIGILILVVVLAVSGFVWAVNRLTATGGTPPQATTQVPTTSAPTTGTTLPPASTPLPRGGSTSPIAEGDFTNSPGPITGPAIVEFWNGQGGANDVCGTFQLPSGQTFSWSPAGHWWKYKSDQDMQAEWSLHLALFNQKPENAPCTRGQRPPG